MVKKKVAPITESAEVEKIETQEVDFTGMSKEQIDVHNNPGVKFVVDSKEFKTFLGKLQKCKIVKSTLPILENYKLTVGSGKIIGEATDLEFTLFEEIEVGNFVPGTALFPRDAEKLLVKIPAQPIVVEIENICKKDTAWDGKEYFDLTSKTVITTENGKFEYDGGHVSDYPLTDAPEPYLFGQKKEYRNGEEVIVDEDEMIPIKEVNFTAERLLKIITNCLPYVSKDDLRPITKCLSFVWGIKNFVAASDLHVMNLEFIEPAQEGYFHMPSNIATILKSFIKDEDVTIRYADKRTEVLFGKSKINFRNGVGAAPGFLSVIPQSHVTAFEVNKADLKSVLDRSTLLANPLSVFYIKDGLVKIISEDAGYGRKMKESLSAVTEGEFFPIGFDKNKILKVVNTLPGNTVKLYLNSADTAVVWKTETRIVLVMPMQIGDNFKFED